MVIVCYSGSFRLYKMVGWSGEWELASPGGESHPLWHDLVTPPGGTDPWHQEVDQGPCGVALVDLVWGVMTHGSLWQLEVPSWCSISVPDPVFGLMSFQFGRYPWVAFLLSSPADLSSPVAVNAGRLRRNTSGCSNVFKPWLFTDPYQPKNWVWSTASWNIRLRLVACILSKGLCFRLCVALPASWPPPGKVGEVKAKITWSCADDNGMASGYSLLHGSWCWWSCWWEMIENLVIRDGSDMG